MKQLNGHSFTVWLGMTILISGGLSQVEAQQIVPGTGKVVTRVGDNFEDENWKWIHNYPKSSRNIDKNARFPLGGSNNGRWVESAYRGSPDQIERVATPEGGIAGSKGSLLMRTLNTGVPGYTTREPQQDDLLLNVTSRVGLIPVSAGPSAVVRVYVPSFDKWDAATSSSLGIRLALKTTITERKSGFLGFKRTVRKDEEYWPGFFLQFRSKNDPGVNQNSASILIRGNSNGNDFFAKHIQRTGWWTFGISVSPNGQVHYYARPGVENLTQSDYLASSFPYSYKAEYLNTFFFNVVSRNDSKHWSTPWVIDDPAIYTASGRY